MTHRLRLRDFSGYAFLLPYLVLFAVFLLLPLAFGLWLSVMRYELLSPEPPKFIGFDNYREAFGDPYFWKALWATRMVTPRKPMPPRCSTDWASTPRCTNAA